MSKSLKRLNNKISNNVNKNLGSLSKSYNKAIGSNKLLTHGISALIILAILLVDYVPVTGLAFLNNSAIRLVVITLICLLCLVDPIKSLLLAILFVVLIQKLHKSKDVVVLEDSEPDSVDLANAINDKLTNLNEILNNNLNKAVSEIVNNTGANAHIELVKEVMKKNVNVNLNEAVNNVVNNVANKMGANANVVNEIVNNSLNKVVNKTIDNALNKENKDKQNNINVNVAKNNVVEVVKEAVDNVVNNAINLANNSNKGTRFNRAENTNEVDSLGDNIGELNRLEKKSNAELINEVRDDVLNVDNRNARKHNNVIGDNKGLANKYGISMNDNLLLGDIPGYTVDKSDKLAGEYRKDINALNNNELLVKNPYTPPPPTQPRKVTNVNPDVARYNRNNLITKNPYPGKVVEMVNNGDLPYRNNVASYNKANSLQGHVNNVGGFLLEGFENTPNNAGANAGANAGNVANAANLAALDASNNLENVQPANTSNDGCPISNKPGEFNELLHKAQTRGVPDNKNKAAFKNLNDPNSFSTQGYNNASGVTGYNAYGAMATKFLCTGQ